MALTSRERRELFSETKERLAQVIGASGKAEELVRLTTQIVQGSKKLVVGTPEGLRTRSTATLADFVIAAKKIAQDTRAVDAASLQKLSSTRKAVDLLLDELDAWHSSQGSGRDEVDLMLEDFLGKAPDNCSSNSSGVSSGGGVGNRTSPTDRPSSTGNAMVMSEHERRLLAELKSRQEELARKKEPQNYPTPLQGRAEDTLQMVVSGLSRSTSQLMDQAGQRSPNKESMIESTITVARLICILLDVVDNLFVSKYPMRPQVHAFTCAVVDQVVLYGNQSKSDDAGSLRLITTQIPALMNALEVMVEQTLKRSQNVKENQQMSLQRNADLHDLDLNGPGHSPRTSPVNRKRKDPPPAPPSKKISPVVQEFEICCMICTSVAVDANTKVLLNKGSEITLKVNAATSVYDVRKMLVKRTSIVFEDVQLRFRGDDVMTDDTRMTPDNPVPYFVFHLHEPGEEEMTEFRREQRRKTRLRIDTVDWSKVPSPVAVAIYDYEAMAEPGEEDNLEFEEGDIIEIVEKSADGWWTGRVDGNVGVFPASFVEMIQIPKTKDERKRLLKRFHQGRLGEGAGADVAEPEELQQAPPARPPEPKFQQASSHYSQAQQQEPMLASHMPSSVSSSELSSSGSTRPGNFNKMFNRSNRASTGSDTDTTGSPSPTKKPHFGRNISEPSVTMAEAREKEGKQKKRRSLFKKKPPPSYVALTDDFQRSPILGGRRDSNDSREAIPELEEEFEPPFRPAVSTAAGHSATQSAAVPSRLFRPKSSPRLANKAGRSGVGEGGGPGDDKSLPSPLQRSSLEDKVTSDVPASKQPAGKKPFVRRPPPPPPPYAKRYGTGGMQKLVKRNSNDGDVGGEENNRKGKESQSTVSDRTSISSSGRDDDEKPAKDEGLVMMMVTPASPVVPHEKENGGEKVSKVEEEVSLPPMPSSNSMEDLFKNLEEFDELSSTQSLNNGFQQHLQKDYTSIPQAELQQVKDVRRGSKESTELPRCASVPAESNTPPMMEDRPCLTPSPLGTIGESSSTRTVAASQDQPPSSQDHSSSGPVKPPRSRSKRKKTQQVMEVEENEKEEEEEVPQSQAPLPPPSNKPRPPAKVAQSRPMFRAPRPPPKPPSPGVPDNKPSEPKSVPAREVRREAGSGEVVGGATSPTAPPRRKARGPKSSPDLSTGAAKPTVRPKPPQMSRMQVDVMLKKQLECSSAPVSRTSSPDDADQQLGRLKQESSTSTTNLASSKAPPKGAVKRTVSSEYVDNEADNCTGVGKEGMLHLESTEVGERWTPRYFQLLQNRLAYFDISSPADSANPLGQFAMSKVEEAVHIGEKNRLHCFTLKMQGDVPVVLGCNSKTEMEDWMKSIQKVARHSKRRGRNSVSGTSQSLCYKTALRCISYLSSGHLVRENKLISPSAGNPVLIKKLLVAIDNSEEVDLNSLEEAPSVMGLLVSLFDKAYLGRIIQHEVAEEMCGSMQSADPISTMSTKLEKLTPKFRELLKKLLRFFSKIIQYSDRNNTGVQDINVVFGPVIFENIPPSQSEPLLAYLISTCEFIIT